MTGPTLPPSMTEKGGGSSGVKGDGSSGSKEGVVVQRVVCEVAGGTSYPTLTKNNYSDWVLLMKVKLKAHRLWAAVDAGGVDPMEDMTALDAICSAILTEIVSTIVEKKMAKEAWDAIATMRVGDDRVKKSTAQQLRRQFNLATCKETESVEDYPLRLNGMAANLSTLGEPVEEVKVVEKMLRSMLAGFKQIILAIQTLLDSATLTVTKLIGSLKAAEEAFEAPPPTMQVDGKLYLTEEEWETRRRRRDSENQGSGGASGSSARRGTQRGRGKRRGGSSATSSSSRSANNSGRTIGKDECRQCGKSSHWARECPSRPKKEQAHVIHEEEEALLLILRSMLLIPRAVPTPDRRLTTTRPPPPAPIPDRRRSTTPPPPASPVTSRAPHRLGSQFWLQLCEEKVFVQLGEKEEQDTKTWVLDIGATNRMSGSRAAFAELHTAVCGTVRFGDDFVARIEGCGTVLFACKNGEHRAFAGIYYIPNLTTNIVSVGQLDEVGYKIDIDNGVMKIREAVGEACGKEDA
ncbi:uncharacterized protein [Setaria viridis]|uniref:uncharacterized protein n=1 Tax=Setaria viridis TaxID=4556 RepID=UPI003B3B4C24